MIYRYLMVGAITTGFYYLLFMFLLSFVSLPFYWAVSVAYLGFITGNFLMHRLITFGIDDAAYKKDFARYIVLLVFNYGVTVFVNYSAKELHQQPTVGFIAAVMMTSTIGFFASKHWVFKER